jgi:Zn finger protein HypA/HybF involved in hydrogenase expression
LIPASSIKYGLNSIHKKYKVSIVSSNMAYQNKKWLEEHYVKLKKSTITIGSECNVSSSTIRKWLIKNNIPRRNDVGGYKKPRRKCKNCGKECNRPEKFYCNVQCLRDYEYKQYIEKWLKKEIDGNVSNEGVSNYVIHYLIKRSKNKCEKCGWSKINPFTNKVPLQVHHKDGNHKNSYEENLEYICPNCHSLTKTYGGANKGNGRTIRKKKIRERKK